MKETKDIKYAELVILAQEKPDEFQLFARGFVSTQKSAKKFAEELTEGVQANGKCLCILKADWLTARANRSVMVNASFPKHYESLMGVRPHNKAESCANAFAAYVLAPEKSKRLITEQDYDDNSAEAIQQASRIVSRVNDDLEHQAVADAADILKRRPKKAIAMLKEICERLVERVENEGTDDEKKVIVYLTTEEFAETKKKVNVLDATQAVDEIAKQQPGIIIAALLMLALTTESEETARLICHMTAEVGGKFGENVDAKKVRRFSAEQLQAWAAEKMPVVKTDPKAEYLELRDRLDNIEVAMQNAGQDEELEIWDKEFSESNAALTETADAK